MNDKDIDILKDIFGEKNVIVVDENTKFTPTKKSPEIEQQLTDLAGISRHEALERKICTWCKKQILSFEDELSKREYEISGLCQSCQNKVFGSHRREE